MTPVQFAILMTSALLLFAGGLGAFALWWMQARGAGRIADPPHRLGELEAHIPAAQHEKVRRHAIQLQGFDVGEQLCGCEPG